jgi:hypothetical protein
MKKQPRRVKTHPFDLAAGTPAQLRVLKKLFPAIASKGIAPWKIVKWLGSGTIIYTLRCQYWWGACDREEEVKIEIQQNGDWAEYKKAIRDVPLNGVGKPKKAKICTIVNMVEQQKSSL